MVSKFIQTSSILSFAFILSFISFKLFDLIYSEQGTSYMDEIFHIPQAKLYCDSKWTEWNPKITTFPGLYIISYVFLKPLQALGFDNFCTVYSLRFTNLLATVLNFYLSFRIISSLEKKHKVKSNFYLILVTAFNLSTFPPLYFFTFLYYTDVWSVTFVLSTYYIHLSNGSKLLGALTSSMAVLMRQTNIIWVGLMIVDDAWFVFSKNVKTVPIQDYKFTNVNRILNWRSRVVKRFLSNLILKKNLKSLFELVWETFKKTYHNLIVCVLFVGFVVINGSIVLGDKDAHSATFHPMQNFYFLNFFGFFAWPFLLPEVLSLWKKPPNTFLLVFLIGLSAGLSEMNKLEHPYLLADNRHLAFYLWRRVFGHSVLRRMIVPTYVCSGILLWRVLQRRCHFMFLVCLSVCTFLNLTPQYLFELRYFIVPFLMYRIQLKSSRVVLLESVFFWIVNSFVVYLFLNKTFVWPSEPDSKQRFIW